MLRKSQQLAEEQGTEAAAEFLAAQLAEHPSVKGLDRLLELSAPGTELHEQTTELLHSVTRRLLSRQPAFRCSHCGFSGHNHHWQCPSCRNWSTTRIIRGVLGE
ncbi:MAG: hypothetical protein R3348_07395 [Xanthomonadales bacterium]|nr:hypothetical protein [Xanthomonadales bacterium]